MSTLATTPRLESDSTPASPKACVKSRSNPKSKNVSVVTASDTKSDMVTDKTEARKRRPRIADKKPLMSSSSKPIRKKNMKMPMLKMISTSVPASTSPVTGPRITPVVA